MQTIDVASWEEFGERALQLQEQQRATVGGFLPTLFRGHREKSWPLSTSLERLVATELEFEKYYWRACGLRFQIEAFTGNKWELPEFEKVAEWLGSYSSLNIELEFGRLPAYDYLAHLRHHGFPAPLLDWTESPFIAAYFAFSRKPTESHVSIFTLTEASQRAGSSHLPRVYRFGPNVRTHRRHFLQQCNYTMCLIRRDEKWQIVSHESPRAFAGPQSSDHPNFEVHKFNIPATERQKVLRALDAHNLNAFSLFGSEESLMETLAFREIEFGEPL
jgi:hypothetical protein